MSNSVGSSFVKIEKFGDKAMKRPTVAIHGRIGWWLVWNAEIQKYEVKCHIFFQPKVKAIDRFEWKTGIWLPCDEFRSRMASIKEARRNYYKLHRYELLQKIAFKRGADRTWRRIRSFADTGLGAT